MKRSLNPHAHTNPPKERGQKRDKRSTKTVSSIRKLPGGLLDQIISYGFVTSRQILLSSLGQRPQKLLWSSIFKKDTWLQLILEHYGAKPVLIGSQLRNTSGDNYVIIRLGNYIRQPPGWWNLFKECLQEHTLMPKEGEIVLASGIILNIQCLFLNCLVYVSKQREKEIFKFREENPVLQYSFYHNSQILDFKSSEISIGERMWRLRLSNNGETSSVFIGKEDDNHDYSSPFQRFLADAEKGR